MMGFIAELRRRNVIRVAGLYLVGAWLITQVSSTVLPLFDAPVWVPRTIVVVLAAGFLPALVFAWVFELTPQGFKRDSEVPPEQSIGRQTARRMDRLIVAGLLAVIALMLVERVWFAERHAAPAATPTAAGAVPKEAAPNSIAVLAFADLSQSQDQAYFSDGMAEEILNALARIKALKVIGRSSSFQFKGKDASPEQIGAALGVAHVLEGSVRKQGDALRITAKLIQTVDGVQQWSKAYDGKLQDVFDLQESCARDIAAELKVVLAGGEQRLVDKPTDNPEAYALFVEAQTLVNTRVGDSLPRAIAKLEQVVRLDPSFARAWSKLAVAHAVLPQYVATDWAPNWQASEEAARRALALDANSAEAYAAIGYVNLSRRRYVEMAEPFARALALDPDDFTANFWNANQFAAVGRLRDAEAIFDHILVRDPANTLTLFYKGLTRWDAGDVAGAVALSREGPAVDMPLSGYVLALDAARRHDYDEGARLFVHAWTSLGTTFSPKDLETIYRGAFQGDKARAAALEVIDARAGDQFAPTLLIMLGESERALAMFEKSSIGLSDAFLDWLWMPEPYSQKARQHPAFQGFAKRIGLVDYWKRTRWPDLCEPTPDVGPDAFRCR